MTKTKQQTVLQPAAAAQITFNGPARLMDQHSDVVRQIMRSLATNPYDSVSIYMNPLIADEPLEWFVILTGPKGRRHIAITQRQPAGAILFN